jgi:hypothetical protein
MSTNKYFIIKPLFGNTLADIMRNLKGRSAYELNTMLNRRGKFWQVENFDHLIRDNISLLEKWEYIKENPVKAKLVARAEDYRFSSFFIAQASACRSGNS